MTPRPRRPGGGGDGGGTPPGRRPSRQHGNINAGNGVTSAITTTRQVATAGRPGSAGGTGHPTTPSTADLRHDADPTPRHGETPEQAAARAHAAQQELDLRQATDTYNALGEDPPR